MKSSGLILDPFHKGGRRTNKQKAASPDVMNYAL